MARTLLLTGLPEDVALRIGALAADEGFQVENAPDRDACQEALLNQEILVLVLPVEETRADRRAIDVMKFYSNSLQFILYAPPPKPGETALLPRNDIIGVLRGPGFDDDLLRDYLAVAVRMNSLEKKIESLNFALQENHSTAAELNLKNKVLERERNFNESIISSIAYGLLIVDPDGAVMLVNEAGKRLFGMTAPDFYGQPYAAVVSPGIHDGMTAQVKEVLASGKTALVEGFTVGPELIVSYSVSVIRDNFDNVIGLMFLGRDITEWETMTQQLFQAEKLATMGTMLSGIAHELRNPVTIINARAQRLLDADASPDKARKAVESIEHQSRRMGSIINNLLDFSRRKVSGFIQTDIAEVLDAALNFLTLEGRARDVEIVKAYASPCPALCDRNQLEQVFLNLFSNACDAMPKGGRLTVSAEAEGANILIRVADTGTGMPPEIQKKIFDPFFTTKEAGKGTGLGLAIVYKIVQMHKGRLAVQSKPGEGTTFTLQLPRSGTP